MIDKIEIGISGKTRLSMDLPRLIDTRMLIQANAGGAFNNALGKLRTLELISGKAELKASDELMGE